MNVTSPIELIREGISSGNWQKVCDGYAGMTGTKIEPPSAPEVRIEFPPGFASNLAAQIKAYIRDYPLDGKVCGHDKPAQPPASVLIVGQAEVTKELERVVQNRLADIEKEKVARPTRENTTEKFRVEHKTPQRTDGKRACRVEPVTPGMTNEFVDDHTIAADDIEDSKAFSARKKPEPRRPPVKKVRVVCCRCNNELEVEPIFAPRSAGDKDEPSSFVCNDCGKKGR